METPRGEPPQSLQRGTPGALAALLLVQDLAVVIQRDPQRQPRAVLFAQGQETGRAFHHRAHGVGQHQHAKAAAQAIRQHLEQLGIHEGLAAREPDFLRRQLVRGDLVQVRADFGGAQIDQAVIRRAGLDIAVLAGQVAERACVEPKRAQGLQRHGGPAFALGGGRRVAELGGVERLGYGCLVWHAQSFRMRRVNCGGDRPRRGKPAFCTR